MGHHIYIASSTFSEVPAQVLTDKGWSLSWNRTGKRLNSKELVEQARGAEAVIAGLEVYDRAVLEALPQLRCISRCGVGMDNVDLKFAREKGITVFNTPDVVIQPVAELTLAMIFDLLRKVTFQTVMMRQNVWERQSGFELKGRKVGILGLGRIGRRVAELLVRLEADVSGYDLYPDDDWAATAGVKLVCFDDILTGMDVISLHLSVTSENPFCLGSGELSRMRSGVLLVNVARGALVDEEALYAAIVSEKVGGVALDVYAQEPYVGRLTELSNVIMTPHVGSFTRESRLNMETQAVSHVVNFFKT
ncbi:MAG: phosphoglycerate dehydrogenase [Candidatus Omnitrophica bacterium]|nr:phosphoglycerate dehydrogenase [Candidatus Omnitrophota bacterium]